MSILQCIVVLEGDKKKRKSHRKNDYVVNITNWLSLLRAPTDQNAFVFFLNATLSIMVNFCVIGEQKKHFLNNYYCKAKVLKKSQYYFCRFYIKNVFSPKFLSHSFFISIFSSPHHNGSFILILLFFTSSQMTLILLKYN